MKYRKYDNNDRPAEIDPKVESPLKTKTYQVTCRRRTTPGMLTIIVDANTPEEAEDKVRKGEAQPGIGLGWIPVGTVEILPDT